MPGVHNSFKPTSLRGAALMPAACWASPTKADISITGRFDESRPLLRCLQRLRIVSDAARRAMRGRPVQYWATAIGQLTAKQLETAPHRRARRTTVDTTTLSDTQIERRNNEQTV